MLVEWIDSHSGDGWQPLDSIVEAAVPVYCRSVGWIVSEANGTKTLVSSISGERNGNMRLFGRGDIAIPDGAIVRIKALR